MKCIYNKRIWILIFFLPAIFIFQTVLAGGIKGKVGLEGTKNSGGVLVYIEHIDGKFSPPQKHALMDQINLEFSPKVLPILAGTSVDFLNSDSVLHNVFTPSDCAGNFNLGTWPRGQMRLHTFKDAGCFATILCDVHPEMQAWIVVLQNPFFAQADEKGEYEIKNIPPGKYELKVWYPFYKSVTKNITVKDSGTLMENFVLKRTGE